MRTGSRDRRSSRRNSEPIRDQGSACASSCQEADASVPASCVSSPGASSAREADVERLVFGHVAAAETNAHPRLYSCVALRCVAASRKRRRSARVASMQVAVMIVGRQPRRQRNVSFRGGRPRPIEAHCARARVHPSRDRDRCRAPRRPERPARPGRRCLRCTCPGDRRTCCRHKRSGSIPCRCRQARRLAGTVSRSAPEQPEVRSSHPRARSPQRSASGSGGLAFHGGVLAIGWLTSYAKRAEWLLASKRLSVLWHRSSRCCRC